MTRMVLRSDLTPKELLEVAVAVREAARHWTSDTDADMKRAVLALFRPAEEPESLGFSPERLAQGEADVAAGRVVELGEALQRIRDNPPSAGDRPGNPMPASAPVAPPPAEEPAWMTSELRKNLDCMVFVDAQVFSQARASMVAAIDQAVQSSLAALRSALSASQREVERLRGEMVTAQREAYVIGRRDGRLANNNPAPAKEEVVEGWRQVARNYYPAVPSGENRSEG